MKRFIYLAFLLSVSFLTVGRADAQTADFENLTLNPQSYWNGSDGSGGFFSGGIAFSNNFNQDWLSWDGFAYSNMTNTTAEGFAAQYNAITGSGAGGSANYAVAYVSSFAANPPMITLGEEQTISGAYFTNNNYAFYSMTNGDDFSKQFSVDDWFKLTIIGLDAKGAETGKVEFKLADGINISNKWTWVNLVSLGKVKQVTFALSSTDNGDYGMNTPAYFCMDDFNKDNRDDDDDSDDSSCFIQSITSDLIFR